MKALAACLLFSALAACTTTKDIVGPNGTPAHAIKCGASSAASCYEKAGQVCPNGYTVLENQQAHYMGQTTTAASADGKRAASSSPVMTPNTLIVECKGAR